MYVSEVRYEMGRDSERLAAPVPERVVADLARVARVSALAADEKNRHVGPGMGPGSRGAAERRYPTDQYGPADIVSEAP